MNTLIQDNGRVEVEFKDDRLYLRLPPCTWGDRTRRLNMSWENTPANINAALQMARSIERDINANRFDPTLTAYQPQNIKVWNDVVASCPELDFAVKPGQLTLVELWDRYSAFQSGRVAETTIKIGHRRVRNHLLALPPVTPDHALAIYRYLVTTKTLDTTKRVLLSLSSCTRWAMTLGLAESDPFAALASNIQSPRYKRADPFSDEEAQVIIKAFEQSDKFAVYAPFVRFLFMTGCRTGEAIALQWQHFICRTEGGQPRYFIRFCQSVNTQLKIRTITKDKQARYFPCNKQLTEFLLERRPKNWRPTQTMFCGPSGREISYFHFHSRAWKGSVLPSGAYSSGIVTQLANSGQILRYRSQYETRHTFISKMLDNGIPVPRLARWVGVSPRVMMDYYAGVVDFGEVPEFI